VPGTFRTSEKRPPKVNKREKEVELVNKSLQAKAKEIVSTMKEEVSGDGVWELTTQSALK